MPYRVQATESARREFLNLPRSIQRDFRLAIEELRRNPLRSTPSLDVHELRGGQGLWTMKVRRFRGLYRFDGQTVVFVTFRLRPGAYKNLERL